MKLRRGYSLLELLIVLSTTTVMLMVAMSVLYMLKETQNNVRQRLNSGRMITRLADQFREDAHMAGRVERVPDEGASSETIVWQFTIQPNTVVRYRIGDQAVRRVRISGDARIHEDYRLPSGVRAAVIPPVPGSAITTLRFEKTDASVVGPRPVQIEAVLGFANRHTPRTDRTGD